MSEREKRIKELEQEIAGYEEEFECCGYGGTELREYESLKEELAELEEMEDEDYASSVRV